MSPGRLARVGVLLVGLQTGGGLPAAVAAPLTVTVVDRDQRPLADAAVAVTVDGIPASNPAATATLAQRQRRFAPGVLVVQTGTAVSFPNEDTVRHHVYSFSTVRPFEIKLYVGTPASPVVFDKAGTAVLGCNIHDQMVGYVHVVSTPYFGVTDDHGVVVLDVPAGRHRLQAWHPDLGQESPPVESAVDIAGAGSRHKVRLANE